MMRTLAEMLADVAMHAASINEPVLAHLCRMAALESKDKTILFPSVGKEIVGIWDWDVPNDLNHLDPPCAELFGVDPAKAGAGLPNATYLPAVHPDDAAPTGVALRRALREGGVFEAQYRIITNNRIRTVFARGYCTLDKSKRPERFPGAILEVPGAR